MTSRADRAARSVAVGGASLDDGGGEVKPAWQEMATVGRVARPHGNRGDVIVNPETDFLDGRFQPGAQVYVERAGEALQLRIDRVRVHRGRPIVGFEGCDTISAAEALHGVELRVPVEALTALPAGTFYRHDLIGCQVRTAHGDQVGSVTAVEGDPGRSRLVVEGHSGFEILVPMVDTICVRVDPEARCIVIDPPPGLLELNESGKPGSRREGRHRHDLSRND